ncbi:MAG: cytochrome c-type biogenesis protein CcmH [Nitrospirae bacterium]|nr:cytochrome c-type biogenesis protein CcmH [Nitrospirota bacterium]
MLTRLLVTLAVLGALAFPAVAATIDETEIDVKTREVAKTLRCTVCQSESIWESGSPFARQVRENIRDRVEQGQSADEIRAYFLSRYGDYILMQPPARGVNWVVWIGPFVVLIVGGFFLYRTLNRWVASTPAAQAVEPLDESSRKRIERELHS